METVPLFGDYSFRLLSWGELRPIFEEYKSKVFDKSLYFDTNRAQSAVELEATAILSQNLENAYRLSIGIYYRDEFVGWHFGVQEGNDKYTMRNTGLFAEHRNRGIYSALLPHVFSIIEQKGFQFIFSRHYTTNNAVIVPKLKAGFIITGFEVSDRFGVMVHLSYFFNPLRRKAMQFRSGDMRPDDELRPFLNL